MDWTQGIIALLIGLCGLVGAGVSVWFAVKAKVSEVKGKSLAEQWAFVMEVADSAMKEAEATAKKGKGKKEMVIQAVKSACKTAGIDVEPFVDKLCAYIDQCIAFVNSMNGKGE